MHSKKADNNMPRRFVAGRDVNDGDNLPADFQDNVPLITPPQSSRALGTTDALVAQSPPGDGDDGWAAMLITPSFAKTLLLINSLLLFILLIVCLVMYHRVQVTLEKVDKMTGLFPNFPK